MAACRWRDSSVGRALSLGSKGPGFKSHHAVICGHRRLNYSILTDAHKIFINESVRAFLISDATESRLVNPATD